MDINDGFPKDKVFWYTQKPPEINALNNNLKANIVVVGGGVVGLTCAQVLKDHQLSVVLVEKNFCGGGASGKSSGFVTPDSETELRDTVKSYGEDNARQIRQFALTGVDIIRNNIERFNISCDYQVQDSLYLANSQRDFKKIKLEHEVRQKLGYQSTLYNRSEIDAIIGSPKYFGAVRYSGTFAINSYLYCQAMKEILRQSGVSIYENTPVTKIRKDGLQTSQYTITADRVILCLDRFLPELGLAKDKIYHLQTFVTVSEKLSPDVIKKIFPRDRMMAWDTDLIFHYFRVTGDNRLMLGGGSLLYTYLKNEKHNALGVTGKLSGYFQDKFPGVKVRFEYMWPGLLGVTKDFLPLAGQDSRFSRVYFMAGSTGLPQAAALGSYLAEKIINRRDDYDKYFSISRKFPVGKVLQKVIGTPLAFALSHGLKEYFK